jgi:hypothetical protein
VLDKPIDQIVEEDLKSVVENQTIEQRSLEYKSQLPGKEQSDKKEFLAEVSSLANTIGGTIIYGIREDDKHVPKSVDGIDVDDADETIRGLEQMVRDGIRPRIPHFTTRALQLSNGKKAFLMRVERSWASPHMVSYGGNGRFYYRSSNGKYPMDVDELRDAFGRADALSTKMKRFIQERNIEILIENTPVKLEPGAKLICHFIPFSFSDSLSVVALKRFHEMINILCPSAVGSLDGNYNFEGFCAFSGLSHGTAHYYVQLFRNGIIEVALNIEPDDKTIEPLLIEEHVLGFSKQYLSVLKELGITPPIALSITILGANGYTKAKVPGEYRGRPAVPIPQEELTLPIIQFDDYGQELTELLKPSFDALFNALGIQRSPSYNEKGIWTRR